LFGIKTKQQKSEAEQTRIKAKRKKNKGSLTKNVKYNENIVESEIKKGG
jgi:hypothetical protein